MAERWWEAAPLVEEEEKWWETAPLIEPTPAPSGRSALEDEAIVQPPIEVRPEDDFMAMPMRGEPIPGRRKPWTLGGLGRTIELPEPEPLPEPPPESPDPEWERMGTGEQALSALERGWENTKNSARLLHLRRSTDISSAMRDIEEVYGSGRFVDDEARRRTIMQMRRMADFWATDDRGRRNPSVHDRLHRLVSDFEEGLVDDAKERVTKATTDSIERMAQVLVEEAKIADMPRDVPFEQAISEGAGAVMGAIVDRPSRILNIFAESSPSLVAATVGGVMGAAMRLGAAAGSASGIFLSDALLRLRDETNREMEKRGLDPSNPEDLERVIEDRDLMRLIGGRAVRAAATVALVEGAVGVGFAGATGGLARRTATGAATGPAAGFTGEIAAGQAAEPGRELELGEATVEAVAGITEVAGGAAAGRRAEASARETRETVADMVHPDTTLDEAIEVAADQPIVDGPRTSTQFEPSAEEIERIETEAVLDEAERRIEAEEAAEAAVRRYDEQLRGREDAVDESGREPLPEIEREAGPRGRGTEPDQRPETPDTAGPGRARGPLPTLRRGIAEPERAERAVPTEDEAAVRRGERPAVPKTGPEAEAIRPSETRLPGRTRAGRRDTGIEEEPGGGAPGVARQGRSPGGGRPAAPGPTDTDQYGRAVEVGDARPVSVAGAGPVPAPTGRLGEAARTTGPGPTTAASAAESITAVPTAVPTTAPAAPTGGPSPVPIAGARRVGLPGRRRTGVATPGGDVLTPSGESRNAIAQGWRDLADMEVVKEWFNLSFGLRQIAKEFETNDRDVMTRTEEMISSLDFNAKNDESLTPIAKSARNLLNAMKRLTEPPDAQAIRSDEGPIPGRGIVPTGRREESGADLQRREPGQPGGAALSQEETADAILDVRSGEDVETRTPRDRQEKAEGEIQRLIAAGPARGEVREETAAPRVDRHAIGERPVLEGRTAASRRAHDDDVGLARSLMDLVGLDRNNVHVVDTRDIVEDAEAAPETWDARFVEQARRRDVKGFNAMDGDDVYIALSPDVPVAARPTAIAHEVGHVIKKTALKDADPQVRRKIIDEYKAFKKRTEGARPSEVARAFRAPMVYSEMGLGAETEYDRLNEITRFDEYFADQVAKWASTSKKPKTLVDRFFKGVADRIRRVYAALTGKDHLPNKEVRRFLDDLVEQTSARSGLEPQGLYNAVVSELHPPHVENMAPAHRAIYTALGPKAQASFDAAVYEEMRNGSDRAKAEELAAQIWATRLMKEPGYGERLRAEILAARTNIPLKDAQEFTARAMEHEAQVHKTFDQGIAEAKRFFGQHVPGANTSKGILSGLFSTLEQRQEMAARMAEQMVHRGRVLSTNPLKGLEHQDLFLTFRSLAQGEQSNAREVGAKLYAMADMRELKRPRNISRKAFKDRKRTVKEVVYEYMTHKDADRNVLLSDAAVAKIMGMPVADVKVAAAKLRDNALDAKTRMIQAGEKLVKTGIMSEEAFRKYGAAYLPNLYVKHLLENPNTTLLNMSNRPSPMDYSKKRSIDIDTREAEVETRLQPFRDPGFGAGRTYALQMSDAALFDWMETLAVEGVEKGWVQPHTMVRYRGRSVTPQWLKSESASISKRIGEGRYREGPELEAAKAMRTEMDTLADDALKAQGVEPVLRGDQWEYVPTGVTRPAKQGLKNQYRQIPDSARYGPLRGMSVHKAVYNDITSPFSNAPGEMGKIVDFMGRSQQIWKTLMVPLNFPIAFDRNGIGGLISMYVGGVGRTPLGTARWWYKGFRELRKSNKGQKSEVADIARRFGILRSTYSEQELGVLDDSVRHLMQQMDKPNAKEMLAYGTSNIWRIGTKPFLRLYQGIEVTQKMGVIAHAMEKRGMSPEQAVISANRNLFDYGLIGRWAEVLRRLPFGAPFMTYTYKVLPTLAYNAVKHPIRTSFMVGVLPWILVDESTRDWTEEDWEGWLTIVPRWIKENLERETAFETRIPIPFTGVDLPIGFDVLPASNMVMPYKDEDGIFHVLDFGYWMPWQSWVDVAKWVWHGIGAAMGEHPFQRPTAEPVSILGFGSTPAMTLFSKLVLNIDPFTKRKIDDEDRPAEWRTKAWLAAMWNTVVPSGISTYGALMRGIDQEVFGIHNPRYGPKFTTGQLIAKALGVNTVPLDPDTETVKRLTDIQMRIAAAQGRMANLALSNRETDPEELARELDVPLGELEKIGRTGGAAGIQRSGVGFSLPGFGRPRD